jgi:hypothetical protein
MAAAQTVSESIFASELGVCRAGSGDGRWVENKDKAGLMGTDWNLRPSLMPPSVMT